jgi:hypothetical protein
MPSLWATELRVDDRVERAAGPVGDVVAVAEELHRGADDVMALLTSRAAATELSTPPDIATRTFLRTAEHHRKLAHPGDDSGKRGGDALDIVRRSIRGPG